MAERYEGRRFGDRRDGRRLRSIAAIQRISPILLRSRAESANFIYDSVEITAAEDWLSARRIDGPEDLDLLHLVIAAYVRTVALCPSINRFCVGHRLFSRPDIEVVLADSHPDDSGTQAIKVRFDRTDTIGDVYRKISDRLDQARAESGAEKTEHSAEFLLKLPRFVLRFGFWLLRGLDNCGWLPLPILDASPYHGSMLFTLVETWEQAPIRCQFRNFGTLPLCLSAGLRRSATEVDDKGRILRRRYLDLSFTIDERITENAGFSQAVQYIKYFLSNPALLEKAPAKIRNDSM